MIKLEKEIRVVVEAIVRGYQPERIILFGSAVRGMFQEGSDLDLFIIKETHKKPMERVREVVEFLPHTLDTDLIVLTPSELAVRQREGNYLLKEILNEGRVLYERRAP